MVTAELVKQNLCALRLAQIAPVRHFDQEPEAIGQCRIQWLRTQILLLLVVFAISGWVHGGPAITQLLEFHALHAPLVDDPRRDIADHSAIDLPMNPDTAAGNNRTSSGLKYFAQCPVRNSAAPAG